MHETLLSCTIVTCIKLLSGFVVGVRFLEVFNYQYNATLVLFAASYLFGSYLVFCVNVACGVVIFGDSLVLYGFAPDFVNCLWSSISLYLPLMLRVKVQLFVSVCTCVVSIFQ
jgi:hypothetical protein